MTTDPHAQARAYVQARLDDRLAPDYAAWLSAHLAGCRECRRYAAEHERLAALLPGAFQARWPGPHPAVRRAATPAHAPGHSAPLPIGGSTVLAREKKLNLAGLSLGLGALLVLLIGVAFALQTATLTESRIPGQADQPTALPPLFEPVPMQFGTYIRFGDAIALEGYSFLPYDGGVTVQLLWHALAVPAGDYAVGVFVMPDGAQSAILAQSDRVPVNGTRPTSGWQAGEYLVDSHDLPLIVESDLANLVLWVNVYDPNTGDRLPSDPSGGGPFNATVVGAFSFPADPPWTHTPLPFPSGEVPTECVASPCTPTPTPADLTSLPCTLEGGCDSLWATGTAAAIVGATGTPLPPEETPTACADGCALDPSAQATADMAATLGWTPTPLGFVPSVTPCQVGCPEATATPTP